MSALNTPRFSWLLTLAYALLLLLIGSISGTSLPLPAILSFPGHIAAYGLLGWLIRRTLLLSGWEPTLSSWVLALVLATAVGTLDEINQLRIPGRMGDWLEVVADAVGALTGAFRRRKNTSL